MNDTNMNLLKQKEFEDMVMNMLLDGPNEILLRLKEQYKRSKIMSRDFDEVGLYVNYEIQDFNLKIDNLSIEIGDVGINYNNIIDAYGCLLFVRNGFLSCLEFYSLSMRKWNTDYENFSLYYYDNPRNLEKIKL